LSHDQLRAHRPRRSGNRIQRPDDRRACLARSEKSDCESKGGTYSETTIVDNGTGETGTSYSCCVKDAKTRTSSCTNTTVAAAENWQPARPIHRVPLEVLNAAPRIEQAP
jgi:hypothetical protein